MTRARCRSPTPNRRNARTVASRPAPSMWSRRTRNRTSRRAADNSGHPRTCGRHRRAPHRGRVRDLQPAFRAGPARADRRLAARPLHGVVTIPVLLALFGETDAVPLMRQAFQKRTGESRRRASYSTTMSLPDTDTVPRPRGQTIVSILNVVPSPGIFAKICCGPRTICPFSTS